LRIFEFIPVAIVQRPILTWREVMSGMIRMSFTSEVRHLLTRQAGVRLRQGGHDRVQLTANTTINSRRPDWFEQFVEAIESESGIESSNIRALIARWGSITDSLKYLQLGSPENIVIVGEPTPEELSEYGLHFA
jgi:hypothetical protein